MNGPQLYYFIDPIASNDAGITTYIKNASEIVRRSGFSTYVLEISKGEDLENFRKRVGGYFSSIESSENVIVEAPETYACTKYVPGEIRIHIRLHFSKVLGNYIERKPIDSKTLEEEQIELRRARFVSSPSIIGEFFSRCFFDFSECSVYPNPLIVSVHGEKEIKFDLKKKPKVGFIGRDQYIKGISFIKELIKLHGDIYFYVVSTSSKLIEELSEFDNVVALDEKDELFEQVDCVVVPSVFETSSMVILETVEQGLPVVTWNHLGMAEFLDEPIVYKAKYPDVKGLSDGLLKCLRNKTSINRSSIIDSINSMFVNSLRSMVLEGKNANLGRCGVELEEDFFEGIRKVGKQNRELTSTQRKWRKFRRMPIRFFIDVYKKKMGYLVVPEIKSNSKESSKKDNKKNSKKGRANLLCNFDSFDNVSFNDYKERNSHLRACVVFDKKNYKDYVYKDLIESLYSHEDFWPLRRNELGRGYIDYSSLDKNLGVSQILDKVPLKQRDKLKNIKAVFLVDCFDVRVFEFFSSCNPALKVIAIFTGLVSDESFRVDCISESIDIIVRPVLLSVATDFRKEYVFSDVNHVNLYIRKVLQETNVDSDSILLPVYNAFEYRPDFEFFDTKSYGGIIYIDSNRSSLKNKTNFDEWLSGFSEVVSSMYVSEAVYLNYKTLCDDIEYSDNLKSFLRYSLKDGVLFDVREV